MNLRERLVAELRENNRERGWPTWWWAFSKRRGESTVTQAREELKRMERDGLVERVRSYSNQIEWALKEGQDA